jgi:xanthine/uracil/vitamin C permease (AzgA family)
VVFVGLSLLAIRAGHRGRAGLVVISVLFLALIWHQETAYANPRWFAALVLAGVGAMVMTSRLLGPSRTSAAPPPPKQQQGFGPTRTF